MELPINKLFYLEKELVQMTGFSKRKFREARKRGLLKYIDTMPIRYSKKMIVDFLELIENDPAIFSDLFKC